MLDFIGNATAYVGNKLIDPMDEGRKCVKTAPYLAIAQVIHVVWMIVFTTTPVATIVLYALNAVSLGLLYKTRMPVFAILPIAIGVVAGLSLLDYNFSLIPIIEF